MKIFFSNVAEQDKEVVSLIRKALQTAARQNGIRPGTEVSVTLADEETIREINRQWRGINKVTDVISFALNEGEQEKIIGGPPDELLGEVVICLPQAARQAAEYGHSLSREAGYLAVHGLLHLIGYDHQAAAQKKAMRDKEEEIMAKLGLNI